MEGLVPTPLMRNPTLAKSMNRVVINPRLCLYNPAEVYRALCEDENIRRWLNFIAEEYMPEPRDILLLYPCSAQKPYHLSRSYKQLYFTLNKLGAERSKVHLVTVSEPFGLVPEEFYGIKTRWHNWADDWYDCPGLFQWWCTKNKQPYSVDYLEACIDILTRHVARFLSRVNSRRIYSNIIACVRTYSSSLVVRRDHTHRRIVERASELARVEVTIMPSKRVVKTIVEKYGGLAWDMYGVAHPYAQKALLKKLRLYLKASSRKRGSRL